MEKNYEKLYLKKAQRWALILAQLPGVEAIFLSGSLAQGRAHQNSDIDFFILATPGKIWTARFWVFLVLKFSGNLAKPETHKGRICPNHFITTDNLKIQDKNAYSANLFAHNQPLYDPQNYFQDFALTNGWVHDFGEAFEVQIVESLIKKSPSPLSKGSLVERFLKDRQIKKIKKNLDFNKPGAKIVLSDQELRFHPNPRSKHWEKQKEDKIKDLEIVVNDC